MLRLFAFRIALITLSAAYAPALHAQTVYKCKIDGKTSYSDRPCAQGPSQAMPPPAAGISPADTMGPQGGDARTLLEADKLRFAREKERARERSREQAREERERVRGARTAQARRQKCDKLRLRQKWAREDLDQTVHGPKYEAARIKLRRQAESLATECPA
jgi:hypothetical protein